jgi:pimeloyl-ACP methyl ester carboxylesterase
VQTLVDFERVVAANRAFVQRCEAGSDDLLAHLGSTSDARDLEAVRRALGEDRISLYGNSGGTPIMERYAELYPAHVRALYLDSVLDYGAGDRATRRAFADTYEAAFQEFAAWCRGDARCALHGQDPVQVWEQVTAAVDRRPIPAPRAGGTVDGDVLRGSALVAVAVPSDWVQFGQGLAQAAGGDASWFAVFWPQLFQVTAFDQVVLTAQLDILCANGYSRVPSYAALKEEQRELRAAAPEVGWFSAVVGIGGNGPVSCQGFPAPVDPPRPVHWHGSFPVLVVNANVDNATPYALAAAEQRHIPNSVLLTLNRVHGHGAYLSNYSSCIDAAVERYLFELHLPPSGTVCQPDQPVPGA